MQLLAGLYRACLTISARNVRHRAIYTGDSCDCASRRWQNDIRTMFLNMHRASSSVNLLYRATSVALEKRGDSHGYRKRSTPVALPAIDLQSTVGFYCLRSYSRSRSLSLPFLSLSLSLSLFIQGLTRDPFVPRATRTRFPLAFPATNRLRRSLCIKPFEPNNPCRLQLSRSGNLSFFRCYLCSSLVSVYPTFLSPSLPSLPPDRV